MYPRTRDAMSVCVYRKACRWATLGKLGKWRWRLYKSKSEATWHRNRGKGSTNLVVWFSLCFSEGTIGRSRKLLELG